ncbi:MAG: decarboxylase, partial [Cyanobacteria bacterium J06635_10]
TRLLNWGITTFNLDSVAQLQVFCEVYQRLFFNTSPEIKLGLRLNLPEITGDSRIGVRPNEFVEAVEVANQVNLKVRGLHFYRGTGTNATKAFTQVINQVIETAKLLPDWQYLDFGGGFGYPYHHDGVAFDWESFGKEITDVLLQLDRKIDLIIEPGRAAIAGCATLLAEVVSVKWQQDKQIIGTNTTVANLSVPSVHGGYREIVSWKSGKFYLTDVCGNTTYSRDYLGKNCQLPKLEIGDIIAILDVGAYGYAMSSHFLHRPRPAEVLLESDRHKLIRQREDYDILLHNQIFN